jgi:ABC-type Fe3+-hydroxamate transport system substrate-binding protein
VIPRAVRRGAVCLTIAAACAAAACARESSGARGPALVDDFGDTVAVAPRPRRIVSLNPTTTEILFAIGAGGRLVGRTHWDAYPDSARLVPDLGNGLRPNVEAVLATRPDLVVLYASADNRDAARALRAARVRTLALKVDGIAQFQRAVVLLGRVTGDTARAAAASDTVLKTLARVRAATADLPRVRVFWHVWDSPLMTVGGASFMTQLVDIAGGRNVYADLPGPSAQISLEDVIRRDPDVVLAGPEGARRIAGDPAWRAVGAVRRGRVLVVDTALVGRPSLQLGQAAVLLAERLHPGAVR